MAVKASTTITLNSVVDINATYRYYLLQSSTLQTPTAPTVYPPGGSWTDAEPTYTPGSTDSLYFVDLTIFSNYTDGDTIDKKTFSYSKVSKSTAYEAAKEAYNEALRAQNSINNLEIGGRNLFSGYGEEEIQLNDYQNTGSFTQFDGKLTFNPCETVGETYTISFWAKSPNGSTPLYVCNQNGNARHFYFERTTLTNSLGTEWEYFKTTIRNADRGESYADSTCNRIEIYAANKMGVLVKKIKVEKGDKATDWTPAPEDVNDSINEANNKAEEIAQWKSGAEVDFDLIKGILNMLAADENGNMTSFEQTAEGWKFNFANLNNAINNTNTDLNVARDDIDSLLAFMNINKEYIDFKKIDGEPCIELGVSGSPFKIQITNTRITFMENSDVPTYIKDGMLNTEKVEVKQELHHTNTSSSGSFVWKMRQNGNLGLSWNGVVSADPVVETCVITLDVDAYGDIYVEYIIGGLESSITAPANGNTTIEVDCGSEISLIHMGGESLSFNHAGFTVISDNGDVMTLRVPSEGGTYEWSFDHS